MKHLLLSCLLLAALLGLSQCKKSDPAPAPTPSQLDLLPPATQTGQRTFGCLVNGKAWTPAGSPLAGPLFSAGYSTGNFYLTANRAITLNNSNSTQRIQIEIDSIKTIDTYILRNATSQSAEFSDRERSCTFLTDAIHPATVVITKLDLVNRIVAGTFAFTLETPACGKLTVTDGRFDSRF